MIRTAHLRLALALGLIALPAMYAQDSKPPHETWTTKTFDLKYIDPDQVRRVFEGQSHVMDANRELKLLTARGSATFLKEVEDTIKRLDIAPPAPVNTQINVYLLAAPAQAPTATALPAELNLLAKELPLKLADLQMLRVRAGQAGETTSAAGASSTGVALSRIRVDSTAVNPGAKGDIVSLNGLRIWLNIPAAPDAPPSRSSIPGKNEPDVTADIDVAPDEPVVVAKIGVEKPLAVVVRVGVVR